MKKVCVITGGGSGMGFATAELMGNYDSVIISGRNKSKLESAAAQLQSQGVAADIFPCDVGNREEVNQLAEYASQKGTVSAVVHSAGISPQMGTVDAVFNINALGTIYMNEAFKKVMPSGGCIIDVSSMSAYLLPFIVPQNPITNQDYALCMIDIDAFQSKLLDFIGTLPGELQEKVSYALSKHFVIWYAAQCACIYGRDGIRVISISPGTFDTPLGNSEGPHAASYALNGALGRVGKPEEIAQLIAFCASDAASYITGIDFLCDGGTMAALKRSMENRQQ